MFRKVLFSLYNFEDFLLREFENKGPKNAINGDISWKIVQIFVIIRKDHNANKDNSLLWTWPTSVNIKPYFLLFILIFSLGKTIQVIAFLAGMFDADLIRHVLIVAPLSILVNWEKEIGKW